jgi:hypothetical protein
MRNIFFIIFCLELFFMKNLLLKINFFIFLNHFNVLILKNIILIFFQVKIILKNNYYRILKYLLELLIFLKLFLF